MVRRVILPLHRLLENFSMRYLLFIVLISEATCGQSWLTECSVMQVEKYICNERSCEPRLTELITCNNIEQMHSTENICESYACTITFTENDVSVLRTNSFVKLRMLEQIFLNDSNIDTIENGAFSRLEEITTIRLNNNRITNIAKDSFTSLRTLAILDLSRNQIDEINEEVFEESNNIKYLDISFNRLSELKGSTLQPIYTLNVLNISNNVIKKMDESWCHHLHYLQYLILDNNEIDRLIDCSSNSNINVFSVSGNSLTNINNTLFPKSLKKLFINNNNISMLNRNAFENLKDLEVLDISKNQLNILPFGIFTNLELLTTLDISQNKIKIIRYGVFYGLNRLKFLNISYNRINHVDAHMFISLPNITNTDISNNFIKDFNAENLLNSCTMLRSVKIDGNNFSCVHLAEIISFTRTKGIHVQHGIISDAQNIYGMKCFEEYNIKEKQDDVINMSNNTKNFLVNYFDRDFKNSAFFKFFQNFKSPVQNSELKINEIIQTQKDVAKNMSQDIHKLLDSENTFLQKFLTDLSTTLIQIKNKKIEPSDPIYTDSEYKASTKSGNSSFEQFLEEFSNVLNRSRSEFDNLRETEINSIQLQTNAALKSDDSRMENMITLLNQLKLFIIICILILITFCAVKTFRYFKMNLIINGNTMAESQELPLFNQRSPE